MTKTVLVLGGGGFIGSHLVDRLSDEGCKVVAADLKYPEYSPTSASTFHLGDLGNLVFMEEVLASEASFDEIYQLAADMGGAGYIFTGLNDANVMSNSAGINLNLLRAVMKKRQSDSRFDPEIFYSSSACIYPQGIQSSEGYADLREENAYPADPDSEYGWEKLFSERLFLAFGRNFKLKVHVARYHNIFGPMGTFEGGREKAPAALCRKIAIAARDEEKSIQIWGSGNQTRSFLYVDDCVEATIRLTRSNFQGPVNIGSEEMVTIRELASMISEIAQKPVELKSVDGPIGVNGRTSNNQLIEKELSWSPKWSLEAGLRSTYSWINAQVTGN